MPPGLEAPHDLLRRLDRLERQRIDVLAEAQQAAQGGVAHGDVVYVGGKALVRGRRSLSARGVLKRRDRLGVPAVVLAAPTPGVDPAGGEQLGDRGRVGARVAVERLARDRVEAHSLDPRGRAREVAVDDLLLDPDDLEDLRARVGADGRDPHLGEDLQESLADRADHALLGVLRAHALRQPVLAVKRVERLEHHIWVDCRGPGADQRGDVMDLARLAGLDHEADLQARPLAHEVVVHRADRQQRRHRGALRADVAVRQDDDVHAPGDELARLAAHRLDAELHARLALLGGPGHVDRARLEHVVVDLAQLLELRVAQDRLLHHELVAVVGRLPEQVDLGADAGLEAHHHGLADRVDRRIGDLREELLEV